MLLDIFTLQGKSMNPYYVFVNKYNHKSQQQKPYKKFDGGKKVVSSLRTYIVLGFFC